MQRPAADAAGFCREIKASAPEGARAAQHACLVIRMRADAPDALTRPCAAASQQRSNTQCSHQCTLSARPALINHGAVDAARHDQARRKLEVAAPRPDDVAMAQERLGGYARRGLDAGQLRVYVRAHVKACDSFVVMGRRALALCQTSAQGQHMAQCNSQCT